ncbi:MAG: CoA transferase, partial [Dehalococcoidia bacterium]|nr:CoA transferase [Dehalococcoidia bacterium]
RGYFVPLEHPELGDSITYPGVPVRLSETSWRIRGRAPLIGEHNFAILHEELRIPEQDLTVLKAHDVI